MSYMVYEMLPVALKSIIIEFKCGAELWDAITPCSYLMPHINKWYGFDQDELGLGDIEYFHHQIFHALTCYLITVANVFNQDILLNPPDKDYLALWSSGDDKLDTKVGIPVFKAYLKLLKVEIREHACTTIMEFRAPTKREWVLHENGKRGGWSFFEGMKNSYGVPKVIYKVVVRELSFV